MRVTGKRDIRRACSFPETFQVALTFSPSEFEEESDMKRSWARGMVAVVVVVLAGWKGRASQPPSQQAPPAAAPAAAKQPSTQEGNDGFVQQISEQIAGHEQDPSGQVFKN